MDEPALKILETTTHRTLHAQGFTRSSTQASQVLTDLLSRYLLLLATTCAKYAAHAGRSHLTPYDALNALDDVGVSTRELVEYSFREGKELMRYNVYDDKMITDLAAFEAHLMEGLREERDDAFPLYYAPFEDDMLLPPLDALDEDESSESDIDTEPGKGILPENADSPMQIWEPLRRRDKERAEDSTPTTPQQPLPPALPISPPPSPPPSKKQRTNGWNPPEHVPDFLPPFPTTAKSTNEPAGLENGAETTTDEQQQMHPPPLIPNANGTAATTATGPQPMASSSSSADYFVRVPYAQSSLAQVPEWHLPPSQPPSQSSSSSALAVAPPSALTKRNPAQQQPLATPQPNQSLLQAYHHILTHPPPPNAHHQTHPTRHKVAMALMALTQHVSRWDSADTMYAAVTPPQPRYPQIGPTYAIPLSERDKVKKEEKEKDQTKGAAGAGGGAGAGDKLPGMLPRNVVNVERIAPLVSLQGSRLPDLSRYVLPAPVLNRATMLTHPPVLTRGEKKLIYGTGVPAPWNANDTPPVAAGQAVDKKNEKKEAEKEAKPVPRWKDPKEKPALPDAMMFATWDWQQKNYKVPLETKKPRTGVTVTLGKAKR